MAWNTPRTFTTGEVITATIMNTNLRDNLNVSAAGVASVAGDVFYAGLPNSILPLALGSIYQQLAVNSAGTIPGWSEAYAPLDIVTADTEVVNTASETTIYTSSDIGANLLGTTGAVKLFFLLSYLNNTGVDRALTIRIKLDSTTLFTPVSAITHASSANRRLAWMCYTQTQKGAVNSQRHTLEYYLQSTGALPMALVALSLGQACDSYTNEATSAIDLSTGTHNIVITIQHSVASVSLSCILRFAGLFLTRAV